MAVLDSKPNVATAVLQPDRRPSRLRGALFRLVAVLLGLSPLVVCELLCRGCGIGRPTAINDPFVGFSEIHPLYVLNEQAGRYEIPKSRQTHFQPDSFSAQKGTKEFRIFVLGGSTVQGRPWSIETSFTTWLELNLRSADPSRDYEVINCGGVSYATYRLVPILREVLRHQPDLIIFCEGHNEFLEDRAYASIEAQPRWLTWSQQQASHLRVYNLLRAGVLQVRGETAAATPKLILGPEADARLDWQGGLEQYHRDPQWQREVITHFEFNLRHIVEIARQANVPLVLVNPVTNLEWAPFKSEHRSDLTAAEQVEFERLLHSANQHLAHDLARALELLKQAAAIDDQFAQVHFEIGLCLKELGQHHEAHQAWTQAKELDVCPLRMLDSMKAILRQVAADTSTPLVDAEALIAANSRSGYPDRQWLIDHVHPTVAGHQLIADALAAKLVELHHLQPVNDWHTKRDQTYREHLAGLTHAYFERGQQRLNSEQGWAHGQVQRVRQP